ncbi:MAG: pyridoxal phosphate-dependent aminotransferase [Tissierellales bacterium]|nr:pyridoxal phosphate-dependent aminotransferase [Tissierellales bacterium]
MINLPTLSNKGISIQPSVTLSIDAKAKSMISAGENVISFSIGEPDFDTPKNIGDAGIYAIQNGITKYTPANGTLELRKAICKKFKEDNNLEYTPSQIVVSNGGKHSIYNALMAILNPNDEVIFSIPYWVSYPEMVSIAGGTPVMIKTTEENGFKFNSNDLEKVKTEKTKAIIINSPNNPTGSVYTKEELEDIANWAVKNDIFVISDELYEKLIYDDEVHVSIASLNDAIKNLTIVINGMSKAYSMTGWRIGYTASNQEIATIMSNLQSHTTSNPCSISQYASVEGLTGPQDSLLEMKKEFDKRRLRITKLVNEIANVSCNIPKGAFYVMMNCSYYIGKEIDGVKINSSVDFSDLLLEKCKVAVVPGLAFGDDNYVRLSYATSMDKIEEGINRIKKLLGEK